MKFVLKGVWAVPVIFSILFIGSLGLTPSAFAAEGTVVWINPAEKLGKIAEDGCNDESCWHPFQIPNDLVDSDYDPQVGDKVTFDPAPGNTASNVEKIPDECPSGTIGIYPDCSPASPGTVLVIFVDENNNSIPNRLCKVTDLSGVGTIDDGFTNENGQVILFVDPTRTGVFASCFDETDLTAVGCTARSDITTPITLVVTEGVIDNCGGGGL